MAHPCNSAQGWNIKNRLDDPKSMHQMSYHAKFQVNTMIRLGCSGWGGLALGGVTFSNMVHPVIGILPYLSHYRNAEICILAGGKG